MNSQSSLTTSWQDLYRHIEQSDTDTFQSVSGTEYTTEQLRERMLNEIEILDNGDHPATTGGNTRPVPRIPGSDGDYILREGIDQEWYDLVSGDRYDDPDRFVPFESSNGDTFTNYSPKNKGEKPHQGWKLRVAADADEARDVAETVLPYLQENDISHKVMQDVFAMNQNEGSRQEGKFITIYPEIDDDRQDVIMDDGAQIFKYEDPSWNAFSINSNTKNARTILEDLESELESSSAGLKGRSIDGKNGEEKQYGGTRIHFRYAHHFRTPAKIIDGSSEMDTEVGEHEGLVNEDGELLPGSYIGDQIEAATRPDHFA